MDYTQKYAYERLTGRGFFQASGATGWISVGNVNMFEVNFGIKRKEHFKATRGRLVMDRYDAFSTMGNWQITVDEWASAVLPLVWSGTVNTNFSQSSGTAATFTFTSKKGLYFDIGKYGLNNASLTTPVSKVEGYTSDYVIERAVGKVYIPLSSTIADSTSCTVTYDCPAITYDSIKALQVLNSPGTFELHGEDDSGTGVGAAADAVPPSRFIATFPCILSTDKQGQFKPDDYRDTVIILTLTGDMTVKHLQPSP